MGCVPSSTYPEHMPLINRHSSPVVVRTPSMQSGTDFVYSRDVSGALIHGSGGRGDGGVSGDFTRATSSCLKSNSRNNFSPQHSPHEAPLLRMESHGDVAADGIGLASTTYYTASGRKYTFQHGRPTGFSGAEDIISCLDDPGMQGNLFRLVRSKLVSIGEEEEGGAGQQPPHDGADTLSESEAKEREQGMELVAGSVTARRGSRKTTAEAAEQEQYVVALLGTDAIVDASAVAPSRRRPRAVKPLAAPQAAADRPSAAGGSDSNKGGAEADKIAGEPVGPAAAATADTEGRLSATQRPSLLANDSASSGNHHTGAAVVTAAGEEAEKERAFAFGWDGDDQDFQLHPQQHYSALPAQRKPGGAVPIALCPPSRTLRVPVQYSAVEKRTVSSTSSLSSGQGKGKEKEKGRGWADRMNPQRMFRLATSETRTWAFYNDSAYVMHVYTLFDHASRLEPRDSTRLWASSVFDEGNEAPTPPPVFFGLFFDEEGEEVVPTSEMPDSILRHHQQRIFGSRGMWVAELLVPPRSTRLFVEGKIRGAYRMRCTRLDIDDLVGATETAAAVARRRNAKQLTERFTFSLRRGSRAATARPAKAAAAAEAEAAPSPPSPPSPLPPSRGASPELDRSNRTAAPPSLPPPLPLSASSASLGAAARAGPDGGCHSTLMESQGVLMRQTYIRHPPAPPALATTDAAAAAATPPSRQPVAVREVVSASAGAAAGARALGRPEEGAGDGAIHATETPAATRYPVEPAAAGEGLSLSVAPPRPAVAGAMGRHQAEGLSGSLHAVPASHTSSLPTAALGDSRDGAVAAEKETELDSITETQSSFAEFARVRPGRQRLSPGGNDALFSDSTTTAQLSANGLAFGANPSAIVSTGESPLVHAALPVFDPHGFPSSPRTEVARQRAATLQRPHAAEGLSQLPSARRLRAGGSATALSDGDERSGAGGTEGAQKHTLTPQSSYQLEQQRRHGVPSTSSCRTVAVDDSAGSADGDDADTPLPNVGVGSCGHTISFQRDSSSPEQEEL